ncbi:MAG: hypothetical protein O3A06_06940 [Proteobacteria bacterium]|nr:hypothetical protein [Pseudomonadota bacterium]
MDGTGGNLPDEAVLVQLRDQSIELIGHNFLELHRHFRHLRLAFSARKYGAIGARQLAGFPAGLLHALAGLGKDRGRIQV